LSAGIYPKRYARLTSARAGQHNGEFMVDAMNDTTLLAIVRRLAAELHARPEEDIQVTLDSALERDLGIDSLGRVELRADESETDRQDEGLRHDFPQE